MISMNQIWDESVAFVRQEAALLVPVALATIFVGDVVVTLASSGSPPTEPDPGSTLAILAGALISIVGQLSIVSLVLIPRQSVREALAHGVSRLGKILLIAFLVGLVFSVALIPVAAVAIANGADPAKPETLQSLPGWFAFLVLAISAALAWLAIRLSLMNALVVDRNPGVIAALKGGFALTRGIASRLFLIAALYVLVLVVLGSAVKFVAGSGFALLGAALGSPFSGTVLTALVSGVVSTALSLIATVFLAMLYRRVRLTA